jgi:serine/threonine protein phosphatase PrpC
VLHLWYKTERQDAYLVSCSKDRRYLVTAVADGVSSGRYSATAAEAACREAVRLLSTEVARLPMDAEYWVELGRRVNQTIVQLAEETYRRLSVRLDDADQRTTAPSTSQLARAVMSTTLVVGVFDSHGSGSEGHGFQVASLIGDSSGWILDRRARAWRTLGRAKNVGADVLDNVVMAYPCGEPPVPDVYAGTLSADEVVVLMTDGVSDPLAPTGLVLPAVGEFLGDALSTPPEPLDFARTIGFLSDTWDDDRTAVAVWGTP